MFLSPVMLLKQHNPFKQGDIKESFFSAFFCADQITGEQPEGRGCGS